MGTSVGHVKCFTERYIVVLTPLPAVALHWIESLSRNSILDLNIMCNVNESSISILSL